MNKELMNRDERRRILIVDDDNDFAESLLDILELQDYEVVIANSGKEATDKIQKFNAHAALLDIRLGRSSGIDQVAKLKKIRPNLICVMITAYASIETAIEALQRGAYNYLRKPINSFDLYATLDRCFDKIRLEEEKAYAENALSESEEKYRQFVQNFRGIAYRSNVDLTPIFSHGSVSAITGYTSEELVAGNQTWEKMIYPDDLDLFKESTEKVKSIPNYSKEREYRINHKDGHQKWVHESIQNICDDSGKPVLIEGAIYDITERKEAEIELRQLRNLISNVVDSMPSMLVAVDKEEIVTQWNREAEKRTGLSVDDAKGRLLNEVYPEISKEMAKIRQSIRERKLLQDEKVAWEADGKERYYNITYYPLVTDDVEGAVIRIDDVTEKIRIDEMMVQSEKMLSVGGLAAGMAHEINNPLAGILQSAQVLKHRLSEEMPANLRVAEDIGINLGDLRSYMEQREILRMADSIISSGRRAAEIVDDMLSFSRKSNMKFVLHDIDKLLDKTINMASNDYDLKKKYDFRKIKIIREYDPSMPQVPCDGSKLQQVFLNIFKNGSQAMSEDKSKNKKAQLYLRVIPDDGMARIEIEDNGPGMTEEVRKRVFEPFFTTKAIGIGTGLGLSVSYFIIADNHGGTMTVESIPGKGSKFIISLPLERNEE